LDERTITVLLTSNLAQSSSALIAVVRAAIARTHDTGLKTHRCPLQAGLVSVISGFGMTLPGGVASQCHRGAIAYREPEFLNRNRKRFLPNLAIQLSSDR
jgi:hypothetical protein